MKLDLDKASLSDLDNLAAALETSLVAEEGGYYQFFCDAWHTVESMELIEEPYVKFLCDHMEALLKGNLDPGRLLINIPPGHSKSMICVVMSLPYLWTLDPGAFAIYCHNDVGLARDMARKTRQVVNSEWYQTRWPKVAIREDATKVDRFYNTMGGGRAAVTVRQQITGAHAKGKYGGLIVVDDPNRPDDTDQEAEAVLKWYRETLPTRFGNLKTSQICVVQQRISQKDMSGFLLDSNEKYTHVCLPMHYDPARSCKTSVGEDWRTEPGELLSPLRNSEETVERIKDIMGDPRIAEAQFEQDPSPADGTIFRLDYFSERYMEMPTRGTHTLSCDLTFTGEKTSDFAVITHWLENHEDGRHYLLNVIREKMGFVATAKRIAEYARFVGDPNILIERAANGYAVIDILKEAGIENIHEFSTGRNSKEQRASTVSYLFDRGDVVFPKHEPTWFAEYVRELTGFPAMKHDDQVDATTQYLAWVTGNQSINLSEAFRNAGNFATLLGRD